MKRTKFFLINTLYVISFISVGILTVTIPMSVILNKNVSAFIYAHEKAIATFFMLIIACVGIGSIIFIRHKPNKLLKFVINQIAICMLSGLLCILLILSKLPRKHNTSTEVLKAISYAKISFWGIVIVFVTVSLLSLYLNAQYIKTNNWFIFFTLVPNIIFLGILYQTYLSWEHWLNKNVVSVNKLVDMFKFYERGNMKIDITLLNPFLQLVELYTGILFFLMLIVIGGSFFVKIEKKAIKKISKI